MPVRVAPTSAFGRRRAAAVERGRPFQGANDCLRGRSLGTLRRSLARAPARESPLHRHQRGAIPPAALRPVRSSSSTAPQVIRANNCARRNDHGERCEKRAQPSRKQIRAAAPHLELCLRLKHRHHAENRTLGDFAQRAGIVKDGSDLARHETRQAVRRAERRRRRRREASTASGPRAPASRAADR